MSVLPTECGVCNEEYIEVWRTPRIFKCSHTLCTVCIQRLINDNKKECPFCREEFHVNSPEEVTVNHSTLEFIRYLSQKESERIQETGAISRSQRILSMKEELVQLGKQHTNECEEVQNENNQTTSRISYMTECISQQNIKIKDEILPGIQALLARNEETLDIIKQMAIEMQEQTSVIENQNQLMSETLEKLDESETERFEDIYSALDDFEDTSSAIGQWLKCTKQGNSKVVQSVNETYQIVRITQEKIRVIDGILTTDQRDEDIQSLKQSHSEILVAALKDMTNPMRNIVDKGKLYAVKEVNGITEFARLSIKEDNALCLHYLADTPIPANAILVEYNDVLKTVKSDENVFFIELKSSTSDEILGTLTIRLYRKNLLQPLSFMSTCTGELGFTYASTNTRHVNYKRQSDERVEFGILNDNGESQTAHYELGYTRKWSAGIVRRVYSKAYHSAFEIFTTARDGYSLGSCIGEVESGLSVLEEAIVNHENINEVIISDCGRVLFTI